MSPEYDNIQYKVIAAAAASLFIANTAVVVRLLARRLTKISFQVDDYLIIVALVFQWGIAISGIICESNYHITRKAPTVLQYSTMALVGISGLLVFTTSNATLWSEISHQLGWSETEKRQALYTGSFLYAVTVAFTKLSILWLFYRVFLTPHMSQSCVAVAAIVITWAIATSIVGAFLCSPVVWNPKTPGSCIDLILFYYSLQIPNILTDIVLLLMPVRVILNLPLSKSQKISLLGIFGVGGLTLIVDIIRLVVLIELSHGAGDITYNQVNSLIWTCVEPAVAILAACLPHMRPLDKLVKRRPSTFASLDSESHVHTPGTAHPSEREGVEMEQVVKADVSRIVHQQAAISSNVL